MFEVASKKLGLENAVMNPITASSCGTNKKLSSAEAVALIKKGAYGAFKDTDEAAMQRFHEADVEDILKNNAELIRYDMGTNGDSKSQFSRAVFATDHGDEVDIHDPDF